jgi:TP901 family phage tail tape measure protein
MAAGNSIRAGAAYVELTVDNTLLMRGLKQAQEKLKAFSATVSSWGRSLAKVSALAIAPLALSAHTFSEAASAMGRVRGITGATADEMAALYDQAKRLARGGAFGVKEIAEGMEALGKRGLAPKEIIGAIAPIMSLAKIAHTDLPVAAEMAARALRAFGMEAGDMGHVVDVTAAAARAGKTDVVSIAEALAAAGPAARLAGASFEDTAAAIAVLSASGIQGAAAGTALAMAYKRLSTEAVQKKLAAIGVSVTDAKGGMRQLVDVLADVQKATAGMTGPQRMSIFASIFGRGQVATMQLTVGAIEQVREAMRNADGTAKSMASNMGDPLTRAFKQMKAAAEEAQLAIGEAIGPTLKGWFDELTRIAAGVRRFVTTHKELVVSILKWAVIIGAVATALIGLGAAGSMAAMVIGGLTSIVTGTIAVFSALITGLVSLAVWMTTPVGAVMAIFVAFAATMLIVTGTVGKAMDWLRGVFSQLSDDAAATFQGIKDALIAGDFALAARILWLALKMEWQKGIYWLTEWWVAFKEVFVSVATDAFYGAVKVLAGAWDGLRALWVIIVGFLSNVWQSFTGGILKAWNVVAGGLAKAWLRLKGLWSDGINVDAESAKIDTETQQKNSAIDQERQKSQAAYNDRLAQIGQDYEGTAAEIDKEKSQSHADRQNKYQAQLKAAQDERDQAEQEWKDAIAQAAKERKAAETADQPPEMPTLPAQKKIEASVPAMQVAQERNLEAKGTFSAVAMWGMGLGSTAERTAKASEETAKNTKRMADDLEDSGMEFG